MSDEVIVALLSSIPGTLTAVGAVFYAREKAKKSNANGSALKLEVESLRRQLDDSRARLALANTHIDKLEAKLDKLEARVTETEREKRELVAENLQLRRRLDDGKGKTKT